MSEHSTQETLIICGIERTVDVDFCIVSWGSSGGYWEPPEGAELYVDAVRCAEFGYDMTEFCDSVRDLWGRPTRTLIEALEEQLSDRIDDFADHEPDYDYSY